MDRAFVLTGEMENWKGKIQIGGVFFSNQFPSYSILNGLGLQDIVIQEVKPLSKRPTEPTLYYFMDSQHANYVDVVGFDWEGQIVNAVKVSGPPSIMVPPVSGDRADKILYRPRAFIIKGATGCGKLTSVKALLVVKPKPIEGAPLPDKKVLQKMGFSRIVTVEEVNLAATDIAGSTLFLLEDSPSADRVTVVRLSPSGERLSEKNLRGDPFQLLPTVRGNAADKLFRDDIKTSDFPRKRSTRKLKQILGR